MYFCVLSNVKMYIYKVGQKRRKIWIFGHLHEIDASQKRRFKKPDNETDLQINKQRMIPSHRLRDIHN